MADGPFSAPPPADPDSVIRALRAERDAWAQELFESNRHAAELALARHALADALTHAQASAEADARADAAREIDAARQARDVAFAERDRARAAAEAAEAMLRRVVGSTSWRMTAPVRGLIAALLGRDP